MCIRDRCTEAPSTTESGRAMYTNSNTHRDVGLPQWVRMPVSYTHLDVYKRQVVHHGFAAGQLPVYKAGDDFAFFIMLRISCLLYTSRCV